MKNIITLFLFLGFIAVKAQNITFTDAKLKTKLLQSSPQNVIAMNLSGSFFAVDANGDGEISTTEALQVKGLRISGSQIQSLNDLHYFSNLTSVLASTNGITNLNLNGLSQLQEFEGNWNGTVQADLSGAPSLKTLKLTNNNLPVLDLSANTQLEILAIDTNPLHTVDLSQNTQLKNFSGEYNMFSTLNLSNNNNLTSVKVNNNEMTEIVFGPSHPDLENLNVAYNFLEQINLTPLPNLKNLEVRYNSLTSLDISANFFVMSLSATGNQIEYLNLKNGHNITEEPLNFINYQDNSGLHVICADDSELANIIQLNQIYGYTNVVVTSYCSFAPGGEQHIISGNVKYDDEMNGCDTGDAGVKFSEIKVSDGNVNNLFYTDMQGNFSFPVSDGTYTVTPTFNNQYYTVVPQSFTVNFPGDTSPFVQNFCIAPTGNISDLKVTLIPQGQVSPGDYQRYDLYLENQGVNTVSGQLTLQYESQYVNFHVAIPTENSFQAGLISWNYENIKPFEVKHYEIGFSFNDGSFPNGGLPVEPGDVVVFIADAPVAGDATPEDNKFTLNQDIFSNRMPMNTACLEGAAIGPESVGKYVHYQIGFKNTNPGSVQNIVLKNVIDTSKFNMSSFTPLYGSHSYTSHIKNGNEIEFMFENINLPPNGQGFVSFKIKTLPTLQNGDSFHNRADVYLGFNQMPVSTNTYTTTIQLLQTSDSALQDRNLILYPNPAENRIYLKSSEKILSVEIFDTSGKKVSGIPKVTSSGDLDISILKPGIYFIKARAITNTYTAKFIKK